MEGVQSLEFLIEGAGFGGCLDSFGCWIEVNGEESESFGVVHGEKCDCSNSVAICLECW